MASPSLALPPSLSVMQFASVAFILCCRSWKLVSACIQPQLSDVGLSVPLSGHLVKAGCIWYICCELKELQLQIRCLQNAENFVQFRKEI